MAATMTALFGGEGPDWKAREVAVPDPGPGQIVVRAYSAALNNADIGMLAAADPDAGGTGEPYLAGFDFAGEVVALGSGVDGPAVGERVMGTTGAGAFAQYVLADHRHVMRVPGGLDVRDAATLPTGLLTEHGALAKAGFQAGESVLVTGATAAVGLVGLQVVRALGAGAVIATTRSEKKVDALRELGAEPVHITSDEQLTAAVRAATDGEGVHVVLDHVGGSTLTAAMNATHETGRLVNIGRLGGSGATIDLDQLSYRRLTLRGVSFGFSRADELGRVIADAESALAQAVAERTIRPIVDGRYSFEQAAAAIGRLRSGEAWGKIILDVP